MKILKLAALALISVGLNVVYTGCERHSYESTKVLNEKHGEGTHGKHEGDAHHTGDAEKKAHGGEKKQHAEGEEGGKKVF